MTGLSKVGFAVPIDRGGDVELQVEVSSLEVMGNETTCGVKILVVRLPQHDLLGIADGSARARGTSDEVADNCIAELAANLVRGRVRTLLERRLHAKR
jgi:hypothetical protein